MIDRHNRNYQELQEVNVFSIVSLSWSIFEQDLDLSCKAKRRVFCMPTCSRQWHVWELHREEPASLSKLKFIISQAKNRPSLRLGQVYDTFLSIR